MDVPRDDLVTAAMPSMSSVADANVDGDADAGRGTHAAVKAADARPERMDRRSTSALVVLHFEVVIGSCENPSAATTKERIAPAIGTDGFISRNNESWHIARKRKAMPHVSISYVDYTNMTINSCILVLQPSNAQALRS